MFQKRRDGGGAVRGTWNGKKDFGTDGGRRWNKSFQLDKTVGETDGKKSDSMKPGNCYRGPEKGKAAECKKRVFPRAQKGRGSKGAAKVQANQDWGGGGQIGGGDSRKGETRNLKPAREEAEEVQKRENVGWDRTRMAVLFSG